MYWEWAKERKKRKVVQTFQHSNLLSASFEPNINSREQIFISLCRGVSKTRSRIGKFPNTKNRSSKWTCFFFRFFCCNRSLQLWYCGKAFRTFRQNSWRISNSHDPSGRYLRRFHYTRNIAAKRSQLGKQRWTMRGGLCHRRLKFWYFILTIVQQQNILGIIRKQLLAAVLLYVHYVFNICLLNFYVCAALAKESFLWLWWT